MVTETDWEAHWRELVVARREEVGAPPAADWWAGRAASMARLGDPAEDRFLRFLEPWLEPGLTLIDVGAGAGRHAAPLAARLDWVTAVEPSQAMRELIPAAPNMTVIGSSWADAEPAPADLVISSHVLYPIEEPGPFLDKLAAKARRHVFIALRDGLSPHPADRAVRRVREPRLGDLFLLLRQRGVLAQVALWEERRPMWFADLESAQADCRGRVGVRWDEAAGRRFLEAELVPDPSGEGLRFDGGPQPTGVVHWATGKTGA